MGALFAKTYFCYHGGVICLPLEKAGNFVIFHSKAKLLTGAVHVRSWLSLPNR